MFVFLNLLLQTKNIDIFSALFSLDFCIGQNYILRFTPWGKCRQVPNYQFLTKFTFSVLSYSPSLPTDVYLILWTSKIHKTQCSTGCSSCLYPNLWPFTVGDCAKFRVAAFKWTSHSFCGSEIWAQVNSVSLTQVLSEGCSQTIL